MTDHTLALATAKQAFRKADHAYETAILVRGYAERALEAADHVLRDAARARKTAGMKVRHAAADAAKLASCAAVCVAEYRRQYPD